ncbi:CBL-interacting serine/threonine-protein kinase 9-like protein isoform X1 [Tanacetum coccineum]
MFEKQKGFVKRETSFASLCPANEIMSKIKETTKAMGFNVHKRSYEVFEVAPSLHILELRKTYGDILEFHNGMLKARMRQANNSDVSLVPSDKIDDIDMRKARRRQSARFKLDDQKIENNDDLLPSQLPNENRMKLNDSEKKDKEADHLQDCKPQE